MLNRKRKLVGTVIFLVLQYFALGQNPAITVLNKGNVIEIRNGLMGIVIPSESSFKRGEKCLAPIQSFIYKNGAYSDGTLNYLSTVSIPLSMKVNVEKHAGKKVSVNIRYTFQKEEFRYGNERYAGGESGPGYYSFTATIVQGEKSILMEEDADYDFFYIIKISDGLQPDKARYRGWSSSSAKEGYEPGGIAYRSEDERGYPLDATVDLDYSKPAQYRWLTLWEPAGGEQNSGRYWQVFNDQDKTSANLFGFFQGKPSRIIGGRTVGPQLCLNPADEKSGEKNIASLRIGIDRRGYDNSWFNRKRYQWAAYITTKEDLSSPEKNQPIGKEMNRISGLGNVVNSYLTKQVKLVPAFYDCSIYMTGKNIETICSRLKTDAGFHKQLCEIDEGNTMIWNAWRFPDSAIALKNRLIDFYNSLEALYRYGEGVYSKEYRYWKGSIRFKSYALAASALFADKTIKITASEKQKLEQLVGAMARIIWSDDNAPFTDNPGINYGPANMPFMYMNNGRIFFALLLATDPEFSGRAKQMLDLVKRNIEATIYENGSTFGSPHYTQPTMEPILFSMLQLKQAKVADLFSSNQKIRRFAGFYSSLLTPPSVRFMNRRKLISFGDGSEESAAVFGLLATGLKDVDPVLSTQLLEMYRNGPMRGTMFGPVGLTVDLLPAKEVSNYSITSSNYVGYMSHFRTDFNTPGETAVWLLNGDSLYDHRNDDAGELAIYALGAPLSLSRSSFYYPSATNATLRSVVIPEQLFPQWNGPDQPIAGRSLTNRTWPKSNIVEFANLGESGTVTIKMSSKNGNHWYRKINFLTLGKNKPVIVFYDSLTSNESAIWSMPMMSEGPVHTPVGNIEPAKKWYTGDGKLKQLPSATPVKELDPGINRFSFTGQKWRLHPQGGINWDLYTNSSGRISFTLADWGTTWQNVIELNEFVKTNGKGYAESQQIIRLKTLKPVFSLLTPFNKGDKPSFTNLQGRFPLAFFSKEGDATVTITPDYYFQKSEDTFTGALWSAGSVLAEGNVFIEGGCTEVAYNKDFVKIRIHGNSGARTIKLPFIVKNLPAERDVKVQSLNGSMIIIVEFKSMGLNLANGDKGYREILFSRN